MKSNQNIFSNEKFFISGRIHCWDGVGWRKRLKTKEREKGGGVLSNIAQNLTGNSRERLD